MSFCSQALIIMKFLSAIIFYQLKIARNFCDDLTVQNSLDCNFSQKIFLPDLREAIVLCEKVKDFFSRDLLQAKRMARVVLSHPFFISLTSHKHQWSKSDVDAHLAELSSVCWHQASYHPFDNVYRQYLHQS